MPTLELSDQQVVELVKQLSPERKRAALLVLAGDAVARRDERMEFAESRLRVICRERGLDWDQMTEEQRETFINDLTHEDRRCGM